MVKRVNDKPLFILLYFPKDFHLCYVICASHQPCEGGVVAPYDTQPHLQALHPHKPCLGLNPIPKIPVKIYSWKIFAKTIWQETGIQDIERTCITRREKKQIAPFTNRPKIWTDTSPKKISEWPISIWEKITSSLVIIRKCKIKPQWVMLTHPPEWLKLKKLHKTQC